MASLYPDDSDGEALRRIESAGSNMSEPMPVDFFVAAPHAEAAASISSLAIRRGYAARADFDEESNSWTVVCSKRMIPTYDAIVDAQAELDALSQPHSGMSDGWGTLGNLKYS